MAEEQYDLTLVQGEDYVRRFAYRHADGTYLDFRTCLGFDAQIRARESSKSRLLLDLRLDPDPMLTIDPVNDEGKYLLLVIPGKATMPIEPKLFDKAAWDLFVVMPDGLRARVLQGAVTLDPAATAMRP